jgi:hypothetical protein
MNYEILKAVLTKKQVFTLALASLIDNTHVINSCITEARLVVKYSNGDNASYSLCICQTAQGTLRITQTDTEREMVAELSHHELAPLPAYYTHIPEGDYILQFLNKEGKIYRSVTHLQRNTPATPSTTQHLSLT